MIKFEISSQIVEVAPNNVSQVSLTVINASQIIDFFTVTIEPLISPETMGLYPGWVEFNQPTFSLRPAGDSGVGGDSVQTVIAKINIPAQVYAGNYAGKILVTARSGVDNSVEIPFNIVISQIDAQTLEIQPIESASRKSTEVYRVVVSNQGNAPHIYSVYAEDPNDDLKFTIDPPEVPLRPGEQAALTLKAQPRTRNWVGDEVNHDFKVKMEGSDQEIRGTFKQKAAIAPLHWFGRHWGRFVFFFALLLVLLIVAAIFLLPMLIRPTTSAYCAPVSLRNINVLSNGTTTNILVSGRNGAQPYAVAETEQADKLPGIFASLVSVSPDGRRMAYVTASDLAMNDARIWIKNLDTEQAPIASIPITSGLWPVAPVWSANGEKLAFVVRRPTPISASTQTTVTTPAANATAGGSITGTATTAAPTTAANAAPGGTPGADAAANPSQLDLYVVTKIGEDAKLLASPPGLEPKLFYGNNISTVPLCWASDDASLLVRPQTTDNSQIQVALADGKSQVITPQAGGLQLPKPSLPSLPGLVMPLNSLVGVPASFLQVPQSHFASVQQQTSPGTTGTTTTQKAGTGTAGPSTGNPTTTTNTANTCSINRPFSQNDPRWADLPLREGSTSTMGELGCPITGAAILLNYQNVDTTPAELSSCLGNLTSPLNQAGWFAISQQCGGFKLQGGVRADFSWDLLDSALQKGPTIIGLLGGPSGTHFLVVTGGFGGISTSYTVTDPWDGTTYKTLDYFLSKGYRPRWVISYEGNGAPCVTSIPDTTNQVGIRTTGAVDGGLYQTPQPFRYEVTGSNDTATATVRIVNPRANLDDSGRSIQPNETQTFSTEGNYTIAIAVKDPNGKTVLTRNVYFTIDHTAPVMAYRLTPAPDKTTNKSVVPVNVTLLANDDLSAIASIEYQVNGSQWLPYTSDTTKVPLTFSNNGTYTINYRATDGAGNTATAESINFVIEKPVTAPTGTGGRPGSSTTSQVTPTVNPNAPGGAGAAGAGGAKTSAAGLSIPTVTPVPTQTPRPAVKNTPTVAPTTVPPTTLAATPTISGTSLLPTGSPAITPTATVPLPTTEIITPTATVALVPVLALPVTTLTFLPDGGTQQLQIQNSGNAPLVWTLSPGSSNTLIAFSSTTGNIDVGGNTTINLSVLAANLTGSDENTTFTINSNGGSQTVGVIIKSQPLPSATLALIPVSTSLNLTNTIQVNVTVPNPNVVPNHIDLYATYKTCAASCVAAPVKIGTFPYNSNTLTVQWGTGSIIPQTGIILGGNLCMNADCSVSQPVTPINNLSIDMTAAFVPPSVDNTLVVSQVLTITGQTERTQKVNITILVNNIQAQQFVASAANNWAVTWDTSQISPSSTVVIQGEACNTLDDTGVCLPINSLTGYHTTMAGTVASLPDISLDAGKSLTGTISFVVTPTANVKSVTFTGFYAKSLTSKQDNQPADVIFKKDANNTTFTVPVDTTSWPTQSNIIFNINICFNADGSDCLLARAYTGLFIPAGDPAYIIDLTAQPKYTTINTYFPTPLSVKITDIKNNPVQGTQVIFQVPLTTGVASATFDGAPSGAVTVTTGVDGIATISDTNKLKANGTEGTFSVSVTVKNFPGVTTDISLNNTSPGAKPMTIVGNTDKQVAKIGQKFANPLQVLLDGAAPGISVTFTSQGTGVGATFGGNTTTFVAVTDASGIATAGDLTANPSLMLNPDNYPIVGVHSVRASALGYTPILFTLTNIVGDPTSISPVVTSTVGVYDVAAASVSYTGTIDTAYPDIATVVKDIGGNPLQSIPVSFTAMVSPQPGVFFNNSSSTSQTVSTGIFVANTPSSNPGVAIATGLRANLKSGINNVTATVVGFPGVSTGNFNFLNLPGSATSVEISVPPTTTVQANTAYSASVQATVYDKGHNTILDTPTTQVLFSSPVITNRSISGVPSVTFNNTDLTSTVYTATVSGGQGVALVNVPVIGTCALGAFQITATLVNVTAAPSSYGLSITPGDPTQFSVHASGDGNNQHGRIFATMATPLQTKVLDSCGNPLSNQPVTFLAPSTSTQPSGNFVTGSSGPVSVTVTTNGSGVATAPDFIANSKAARASYSIIATNPNFPGFSQTFTLFNDPGVPKTITPFGVGSDLSTPLSVTVGTTYSSDKVVNATVLDAGGNPVFPVIPAGSNTPPADTKITFVGNVASTDDPNTNVGAYFDSVVNSTFPDESGVITSTLPLTITNKTGSPYQVKAQAVDTSINANFYLENVAGPPANITLSEINFDGSRFQKQVNFICRNLTSCNDRQKRAFNEFKVKVTDRFNNIISGTPVTFQANLGAQLPGGSGNPTANFGALPTTNDNNNRSYTTNTDNLGEITLSPGITDTTVVTDTDITASTIVPGFYAGEYTIDVHTAGATPATTTIYMRNLPDQIPNAVSISITTGNPLNLGSQTNPLTTTVTTAYPQFSAVVRDANGNGIGGKVVTFDMNPASNDNTIASGVWLNPSGSPTIDIQTDSSGNAYINKGVLAPDTATTGTTNLQANKKAGTFTLSASVPGQGGVILSSSIYMKNAAETRVVVGSSNIVFTPPSPTQEQVDQPFGTFNLHMTDQYLNPIAGYPVTFSVPVSVTGTSTGIFSGSGSSKTVQTDANGDAIVPASQLTAGIKAGDFNVTANIPVSLTASTYVSPAPNITLTNLPGAPDAAHITTSVGSIYQPVTVAAVYNTPILVTIADKYGNLVPSPTVSFTIEPAPSASPTVASADFTNPMDPAPNTDISIVGSQATINSVKANTVTGSFTITPHANGVTSTNPIHFTNTSDFPDVLTITSGNNQTPDVGTVFTQSLTVAVFDKYGNAVMDANNPLGNPNQVVFTAPTSGPSAIFTDASGNNASNVITASLSAGVATIPNSQIKANNQLETYNINLSVPGVSVSHADVFTVTNTANIQLVSNTRVTKQAGGEAFGALQVKVSGAGGTGVPNLPVTFSVPNTQYGAFSASTCQKITDTQDNGSVISVTVNTDSITGIATVNNYCAGTLIGNYVVTATTTIGGFSKSVGVPVANTATFSNTDINNNQTAAAGGGVFNPLGVTVLGYNDATIPGALVSFAVTDTTYAIIAAPALTTTNSGGIAQANLTAGSYVGSYNVFATMVTPSGILTHTFTLTNSVNVVFTSSPPTLLAGNSSSAGQTQTITATVKDAVGKGVSNVNIQFSIPLADTNKGSFSGKSADLTDKNGNAVVTLQAGKQLGVYTVSAVQMSGNKQVGTPATLQATTTAVLGTVSAPTPLAGGGSTPISATVTGWNNVAVSGAVVDFAAPANMATFSSTPVTTSSTGIATTNLVSGDVAGSYNVTASLDAAQFNPGPAPTVTTTIPAVNKVTLAYDTSVSTLLLAGGTSSGGTAVQGQTAGLIFTATGNGSKKISGVTIQVTSDNKNRGTFAGGTINGNAITATTSPTDSNGQATATLIAGGEVGTYNVAAVGIINGSQVSNNSLTIGGTTTGSLSATNSLVDIQAGGATVPISITVTGNNGALVNNAPVLFSSNDTAGLSTLPVTTTVSTDTSGVANLNVTSTNKVGFYTVTGNLFLPGVPLAQQPPAQNITIVNTATISTISSASPLAGNTSVPISATVSGFNNTPIVGASVEFTVPTSYSAYAGFGSSSSVSVTTSSNSPNVGVASTNLTSKNTAGSYSVLALLDPAQFGGKWNPTSTATIPITNMVTLNISSSPPSPNLLAASNSTATNGGTAIVTANVAGFNNTAVSGVTVNFSSDDTTKGNVTNATVVDNGSSTSVTTQLRASNGLGSYNVKAQAFSTANSALDVGSGVVSFTAKTSATIATDSVGTATPLAGGATTTYTVKVTGNFIPVQGASVVFSSTNFNRGIVSTNPVTTDSSGNASITVTTGSEAGPYTISATLVGNPTLETVSANFTNTVTIAYGTAPTPLAGGGTATVVITAKGNGGSNIGGVDLTFTGTSGSGNTANGTVSGTTTTGITGSSTVTVTSNSGANNTTIYGAWTLGVTPKIGGTTVSNNGGLYNIPVTNTLLISPTASTVSSPPRPVANGGTASMSFLVSGANNYTPSGVTVNFSTTAVSGCGVSACGTVSSSTTTDSSGNATATATATTTTPITAATAQAYDVQATINISGVQVTLATPIHVFNTVKLVQSSTSTPSTFSSVITATVADNTGAGVNGFTVEYTVMDSTGNNVGSTTTDGFLCLRTCDSTAGINNQYLGAQIPSATISGTNGVAGINYVQPVTQLSSDGVTFGAAGGPNGVNLEPPTGLAGGVTHTIKVRARIVNLPGGGTAAANQVVNFSITQLLP